MNRSSKISAKIHRLTQFICDLHHTSIFESHPINNEVKSMNEKIITVTGHKNCGKDIIAQRLSKYENVSYIKPYTDRELPQNAEPIDLEKYHYVLPTVMEDLLRDEKVLAMTEVNGHLYVFFEFQMRDEYNVLIADDYAVISIKDNFDGRVITVRVVSENETESDRVGEYLYAHEFDYFIDYDKYDLDDLRGLVE